MLLTRPLHWLFSSPNRAMANGSSSIHLLALVLAVLFTLSHAGESNKPAGLFSQVNNWFSRLRGNRGGNNQDSSNNDDKKEEKKEESTTRPPGPMMGYGPPGMYPISPGFGPMAMPNPYAPMMGAGPGGPPGAMFHPMGMSSHHMMHHHHPPRPMAPHHHSHHHQMAPASPLSFAPMGAAMQMAPMGSMGSNPFAYAGSHVMPVHQDYGDATFGNFGGYPSTGEHPDYGDHHGGSHQSSSTDQLDHSQTNNADDNYGYHKKKKK